MPFQKQVCFLFTAAFLSAPRSYSTRRLFALPCCPLLGSWGRQPSTLAFADAQNTLSAAQSRQVLAVTQCGSSRGSFAYQGSSLRGAAAASGTATVPSWDVPFFVQRNERGCLDKKENRKFTKVWMSAGEIRRLVIPILHDPEPAPL